MRQVILQKSNDPKKKFDAFVEGKKVSFGARATLISHSIKTMKEKSYIARHGSGNQDWNDITTAGAWSKHLLWNKPTLKESIKSMESKLNIDIKYKK